MRKIRISWGDGTQVGEMVIPDEPAVADKRLEALIERYGRDAVLEITEAVLDHCMGFRQRVLR